MNNRIQQRFDKSIREAVATTKAAEERKARAYQAKVCARYKQEIPRLEALIERGATMSGRVLTKQELKELREMLDHRKQIVGTCA